MSANDEAPTKRSVSRPSVHSAHPLKARCTRPPWRNMEDTSRQPCPFSVSGPKSAPQTRSWPAFGSSGETPVATIATYTRTIKPRRSGVTRTGCGTTVAAHRGQSDPASSYSWKNWLPHFGQTAMVGLRSGKTSPPHGLTLRCDSVPPRLARVLPRLRATFGGDTRMNGSQPTRIEGALLTELRRVPHRVLHGFRRRRAIKALRGRPRPTCLLVVCRGNICRSPFAAALLHRALSRFGVDLCDHRSQLATAERVRMADLIVVMDHRQRREICERFGRDVRDVLLLGDLDPQPNESRTIRDPVKEPRAVFEQTYARIVRCAREL